MTIITAEIAKALGAKEWRTGTYHRFYFNDLADLYGLRCTYYKTGNISSASLDGSRISNCQASKIATALHIGKVWFDVNTGKLETKSLGDYAKEILREIEFRASEIAKPAKKSPKTVMTSAWEIARAAVAKFGGKIREYFAESLKLAWAE